MMSKHPTQTILKAITLALAALLLATGCAAIGSAVGELTNLASAGGNDGVAVQTLKSLSSVADAATSPFTPEQEYYIGRSVAATILRDYAPYENPAVNDYVNRLGQSLALASQRPVLYHGYTFLVLDHDEINAFASPGGHIFITRGMLALTESEDELAAVLAHEIGHVAMRHGLGSIRSSRVIGAVQEGMFDTLDTLSGQELAEVTAVFGDTTADVVDTLATRGYSGATERQADAAAANILLRVGYDPYALVRVLERMDAAQQAQYEGGQEKQGFSRTHPRPQSRILDLEKTDLRNVEPGGRVDDAETSRRFESAMGAL